MIYDKKNSEKKNQPKKPPRQTISTQMGFFLWFLVLIILL